jgi:hypothetical protein
MREFYGYEGNLSRINSPGYEGLVPSQRLRGKSIKDMLIVSLDIETHTNGHFTVGITTHERAVLEKMLQTPKKDRRSKRFVASVISYQFHVVPAGKPFPEGDMWAFLYGNAQVVTAIGLGRKIHDLLKDRTFAVVTHRRGVTWDTLRNLGVPISLWGPQAAFNTMMLSACFRHLRADNLEDLLTQNLQYTDVVGWTSAGNRARYGMLAFFIIAYWDAQLCKVQNLELLSSLKFMCRSPLLFQETAQAGDMGWNFVYASLADQDRKLTKPLARLPAAVSWMSLRGHWSLALKA